MNPTCAACLKPIVKGRGGRVTIVETQAFHQACVLAGGVARSRLHRLQAELDRLRQGDEDRSRDRERIASLERQISEMGRTELAVRSALRQRLDTQINANGVLTSMLETKDDELARLRAEVAALKTRPVAPPAAEPEVVSVEPEDGTAIRFGLLELT